METNITANTEAVSAVSAKKDFHQLPEYALEYWKLRAMFDSDPDFNIGELDTINRSCVVTVKDSLKATLFRGLNHLNALQLTVKGPEFPVNEDAIAKLFSTNPHFSRLFESKEADANGTFPKAALFKLECMRYYSGGLLAYTAILPQDLARDLFGDTFNIQTDFLR